MSDTWTIVESPFRVETARAYEGLFTLGSGYLHVRGSLEEHLADAPQNVEYTRLPTNVSSERFPQAKAKWGTYVPGVFGKHPLLNAEMINLPWFLGLAPSVDGERLDVEKGGIDQHRRELHLHDATLIRWLRWRAKSGARVSVVFERFVSAARPYLCVQRMMLSANRAVSIVVHAAIDADVRTNGYDHFREVTLNPADGSGIACRVQTDGGVAVEMLTRMRAPECNWRYEGASRAATSFASVALAANEELVVEKRTALATTRDLSEQSAADWLKEVESLSFEQLHAEHREIWKKRWELCDVVVEGDKQSQLALRTSLYHLLRAHPGERARVAIDGKGYTGDAYWGRYFWDSEMFLLPFYLYTDPPRARTLADFRVITLAAARENARHYGYGGARYAWESDAEGNECCPNWQYADHEVHVTADVVYGLAHYASGAGDEAYLRGAAAEVVVETARYWMQRLDWRAGEDHPSLLGVMGPDEYTPISNNNTYTNRLVKFALGLAARIGEAGGASIEEREVFARAAEGLPIPRAADGLLVLQCEGFDALAEPRFDELWQDRGRTFAAQVSQERLYRSKCLKQADVLMLMMLFPHEFSDAEVRRAWDYYVPLTTHDSSLSAGVHAIVACRLGLLEDAWRFWESATGVDLNVERGGAAEGVHIANAATVWQMAVFGFAGMQTAMQADVLTFQPRLPSGWSRLAFPIAWKGGRVYVEITQEQVTVTNRGGEALRVGVSRETREIDSEETQVWTSSI
ncbi:MAG: glycosyl hydrolase family 65 protein [Phycisphaerae bacterium]